MVKNGQVIAADTDEKTHANLLITEENARIIISPIGAQGFILGRGNQQISPRVVERVGWTTSLSWPRRTNSARPPSYTWTQGIRPSTGHSANQSRSSQAIG